MSGKTRTGKPRSNPGVKGSNPHLKEMRRREALERNEKWAKRSPQDQLSSLEQRFPSGAIRQKDRIRARMEAAKSRPTATSQPSKKERTEQSEKLTSREKKREEQKVARLQGS